MTRFEVEHDGAELVIRVRVETAPTDEIVPLTCKALEQLGLEYNPCRRAAQTGELRTVRQGRRRLTTRAWLLAYVNSLPPAIDPNLDDLEAAAARRARRRRPR